MGVDGFLNVLKPAGKTSFAVVSLVRRWSGQRRVGHAGTLDPDATGVLVVCLGQATRLVEYLAETIKTYRADIELGITTDTYDAAGRVVGRADPSPVTEEQLQGALASFRGTLAQVPPMHSAVHYRGKRLYQLAREGIEVDRQPRRVEVFRLELLDWQPPGFTIEIECGGGTYIRSLAHDIGQALGCGACLRKLVRTRSGPFHIDQAVPLAVLAEAFRGGGWQGCLYAPDDVLAQWPAAILDREREDRVGNGVDVELNLAGEERPAGTRCRGYSADGRFLAVLVKTGTGTWHPEKVFGRPATTEGGVTPPSGGCG